MPPIADAALRAVREQPGRNILPLAWSFVLGAAFGYLVGIDLAIAIARAVVKR